MKRGVIFDMDGVMVLTEEAHWRSWRQVAESRARPISHDLFLSCFGRTNRDCVRMMFGEEVSPEEAAGIAEAKESAFRAIIADHVPLAPGLVALLEALAAAGAVMGVGSSAPRENIDMVLDRGGIRRFFSAIIDGGQVTRGKPDPGVFLLAARDLAISPERCIVIEDAPPGVEAARAAGMVAVGVATTRHPSELTAAGAHRVYTDVAAVDWGELLSLRTSRC